MIPSNNTVNDTFRIRHDRPQPVANSGTVWVLAVLASASILSISLPYQDNFSKLLNGCAIFLAIYAASKAPHFGIICCMLLFVVPRTAAAEGAYLFYLSAVPLVGILILALWRHIEKSKDWQSGYWEPSAVLVLMLPGLLWNSQQVVFDDRYFVCIALAVVGIATIRGTKQIREVALAIIFSGVVIAVPALLGGMESQEVASNKIYVFGGYDQNYFGFVPGLAIVTTLWFLYDQELRTKWWLKLLLSCAIVLVILGLSMQGSRSVVVGLASSFLVFIGFLIRDMWRNGRYMSPILYVSALIVLISRFILYGEFGTVWISRFTDSSLETGSGRTDIWRSADMAFSKLNVFQMLVGSGFGSSMHLIGNASSQTGQLCSAHNMLIAILLDGGLVGLLLFVLFIGRIAYHSIFRNCVSNELSLLLLAYCVVQGLFLEVQRLPEFWCVAALMVACIRPKAGEPTMP